MILQPAVEGDFRGRFLFSAGESADRGELAERRGETDSGRVRPALAAWRTLAGGQAM